MPNESERLQELEDRVKWLESYVGGLYDSIRGLALEVIDESLVWDGEHWSGRILERARGDDG
jgi:hypothetical protein